MAKHILDSLNLDIRPTDIVGLLQISKQQMVEISKALSIEAGYYLQRNR